MYHILNVPCKYLISDKGWVKRYKATRGIFVSNVDNCYKKWNLNLIDYCLKYNIAVYINNKSKNWNFLNCLHKYQSFTYLLCILTCCAYLPVVHTYLRQLITQAVLCPPWQPELWYHPLYLTCKHSKTRWVLPVISDTHSPRINSPTAQTL